MLGTAAYHQPGHRRLAERVDKPGLHQVEKAEPDRSIDVRDLAPPHRLRARASPVPTLRCGHIRDFTIKFLGFCKIKSNCIKFVLNQGDFMSMPSDPASQDFIFNAAAPAAQPSAAASGSAPLTRGVALRKALIAASVVATLGLWGVAGWVWLGQRPPPPPLSPPHRTAAAHAPPAHVAPAHVAPAHVAPAHAPAVHAPAAHAPSANAARPVRGKPSAPASFVVLPFADRSNDPGRTYLADAVTAGLTADLSRIAGSFVIARATAFSYREKAADAVAIGRALKVRYVLEGGVEEAGERVRLTARLVDDKTGKPVWTDRFATSRSDLTRAQDEFVRRLAQALNLHFAAPAEPARAADPKARDLVMRGWAWCRRPYSAASWQEARQAFAQALALDPQSVEARIGLATVLGGRLADGWSPSRQQDPARAERLLQEALARDPDNATAHFTLGVLRQMQNRLPEARTEYRKAIALDHNDARAYFHLGQTLMYLGDPKAAIPEFARALRLDPQDPNPVGLYWALGTAHLLLGRTEAAIDWLERARAANPRLWFPHLYLAAAFALRGELQPARAELTQSLGLNPAVNSLARLRFSNPWTATLQYQALQKATLDVGLRQAGLPDGTGEGERARL
jgi:TolB-like protein/Tfp pilus assembly protein PilF